jgi:PAS domain S-box-containing protein
VPAFADDEVGRDLSEVDWSATPLGPPNSWPQSLQTAVSILVSSRFSMWMAWGPELTFFCNAAYRRDTLGRKYPWALGRPARQVWAEIWADIGPRIESVLETGRATWDEALRLFLERSGYTEETYHTFSYSPLRDETGGVVGMLCVVSEETERIIGERRMATLRDLGSEPSVARTEREWLAFADRQLSRNQLDLPFTLTYLFQSDGSAALAGATGIDRGDATALPDANSLWPVAEAARGEAVLTALDHQPLAAMPPGDWAEPPRHAMVLPLLRRGDRPFGFLVAGLNRYRPLDHGYRGFVELAAGHVAAGVVGARSYAAQQQRAEELAELDRAKTTFFSNVSHEFRTPLTLIVGPVQSLLDRLGTADADVLGELDLIKRNGLRLGKLVNTLLDFSRIEAGRMQARFEPADLAAATTELTSVFRSAIEKAGLTFAVDCPPLARPVALDRGMWEKVVLNLLSNALKFTFDGHIRVRLVADGDEAVLTVADTGTGIAADDLPRLFERFHRIENARSRSNEGSGIGLALVKELVNLHDGTVTVASTVDQGTTFTVRLPFAPAGVHAIASAKGGHSTAVSATADPFIQEALRWVPAAEDGFPTVGAIAGQAPLPGLGRPHRLLVVDDNADMREYLARLLSTAGHRVSTAADGLAALEAVRAAAPDLVVSDVMMPGLDGLHFVAALRAEARTASIPVILLSARAGQEASIEGLEAGADDYLVKPFSAAELLARVRANVELAQLRTHHARWRTALVDSLQEAFFVCDEDGNFLEINAAFTTILGFAADGLPYAREHPWWPDQRTEPDAYRTVATAFDEMLSRPRGRQTLPVKHRDGRRVWIATAFNHVADPDTGRRVIVGTFRDVTTERYAVQRESALAALSTRLSEADSLDEALGAALDELRSLWQATTVLAVVFGRHDQKWLTTSDSGREWDDLSPERREALGDLKRSPLLTPIIDRYGPGVCLEHPNGLLVLSLSLSSHRPFTTEDQTLLALLAAQLGQGLQRVHQIHQQREAVLALQRAILGPSQLPDGFAVRYEPAARPLQVGGDWYDAIPLPDGRIGVVVGDCVGRGLGAATVMGQLRSACRALMLKDPRPDEVLAGLDRFASGVPGAACTTVFCGVFDPDRGHLTYASAGHPPGILVDPDGAVHLLEKGNSLPLAIQPQARRTPAELTIAGRATLLLYTDGLVERHDRSITEGIEQAGQVVRAGGDTAIDELAAAMMTRLVPPYGFKDDVALLLYRHPGPLEVTFPAVATELAAVRQALRAWLTRCDIGAERIQDILVAAGEACANAIEHGHRHKPGAPIQLHAVASVDRLNLTIVDSGQWKSPETSLHRGRGLALMRATMQHVAVTPGPDGTVVTMQTRIAP